MRNIAFLKLRCRFTSATSGRPRDWKESWELQSRRLGPSRAVPLEGPEGVRAVRLLLSGETILAERVKKKSRGINEQSGKQIRGFAFKGLFF